MEYKTKNIMLESSSETKKLIEEYSACYKEFLDLSKTERCCAAQIVSRAKKAGFKPLHEAKSAKAGDKFYVEHMKKSVVLFVVGEEDVEKGALITAAHLDAPRLDLKQVPIFEDGKLCYFKTHYYGGIKKYQWASIPLAIYGTVVKANGEKIDISIGDNEGDPVFFIADLLPHLSREQMQKTGSTVLTGEQLNVIIGSEPVKKDEKDESVKANILSLLEEKYGIVEEDFLSSELEVVPAGQARDAGFDRSMICAYGHDDRVCVYPALSALLECSSAKKTLVFIATDKEETGSDGATGLKSKYFENAFSELINLIKGNYNELYLKRALANSNVLSMDVNALFDPNFADVYEKNNSAFIGRGPVLSKYTGHAGKYDTSDANCEYIAKLRGIFAAEGVYWQSGELGKTDQGGGGTVAHILAEYGCETVDLGVGVLSMHGVYEIISKADLYMLHKASEAFYSKF